MSSAKASEGSPPFAANEFGPVTGVAVPDLSIAMIDRVAEALARYSGIHITTARHDMVEAHYALVMAAGMATAGQPQLGGRVLGPSGSGKTTAARRFARKIATSGNHAAGQKPVLIVPLDRACTSRRLFSSILRELGDGFYEKGTEEVLQKRAYLGLRECGVKLLVIDEVQHLQYRSTDRNDVTDTLKRVLDDAICPMMLTGIDDAVHLLNKNKQLANRLHPPCDMPPLQLKHSSERAIFKAYVDGLDRTLVEQGLTGRLSGFAEKRRLACLMAISGGVLGRVSNLVRAALTNAVARQAEIIEVCDLSEATRSWAVMQNFITYDPFRVGVRAAAGREKVTGKN